MKLYGYWRSSSSYRVRIALALKGLAYESAPVHLLRGGGEQLGEAHRERNPMRQIPVLELELDGVTRRFAQSLAILELLEELHPEPPLLPAEPWLRAKVRELAEIVNAGIQPFQNLSTLRHVKQLGADDKAWARDFVGRGLAAFEAVSAGLSGTFSVGEAPSMADACLVPQLHAARRFGVDLAPFPTLLRVESACAALPAFQAAHPDRQVDAEPDLK